MRINHNIAALNTQRQLSINNTRTAASLEKLSSGLRINRAGDDAAGLAISEQMRGQIRGLNQATRNAQDGISLIQTAEGALTETHSILQRMRELAVQASSDTLVGTDRTAIGTEITQLATEITRIATDTQFNGQVLLSGTFGVSITGTGTATLAPLTVGADGVVSIDVSGARANTTYTLTHSAAGQVTLTDNATPANTQTIAVAGTSFTGTLNFAGLGVAIEVRNINVSGAANTWLPDPDGAGALTAGRAIVTGAAAPQRLHIGANAGQNLGITIGNMTADGLIVSGLSVANHTDANTAITRVSTAITTVSTQRSTLGAWQNRLQHTINNLGTAAENLAASESRIRDVDMAKEMMEFTKQNILTQAATAMLAQANMQPQAVLQLLR
jgi:flagellin